MSLNASAEATISTPYSPMPRPHARAIAGPVGELPRERTGDPGRQRREPEPADVRDATEVAPDEPDDADARRARPSTAASAMTDGQSLTPAIGRWPAVQVKNDRGLSASMTGDSVA